MSVSSILVVAVLTHLAAFVAYPHSGKFGFPFVYISALLWTGFAMLTRRAAEGRGPAAAALFAALFALACSLSALAFLPQKDGRSALGKFLAGSYPDKTSLYYGLRRLGLDVPGLLPPQKENTPS